MSKTNPKKKIAELEAEIERLRGVSPEPEDLVGLTVKTAELTYTEGPDSDKVLRLTFTDGSAFDISGYGNEDETGVEIRFP